MRGRNVDTGLLALCAEKLISEANTSADFNAKRADALAAELDKTRQELLVANTACLEKDRELLAANTAQMLQADKIRLLEVNLDTASQKFEAKRQEVEGCIMAARELRLEMEKVCEELDACQAKIAELQSEKPDDDPTEVASLKEERDALKEQVEKLKKKTFAPQKELTALIEQSNAAIKALQKENAALKTRIKQLETDAAMDETAGPEVSKADSSVVVTETGCALTVDDLSVVVQTLHDKISQCAYEIQNVQIERHRVETSYDSCDYSSAMFNRGRLKLTKAAKRELKKLDEKEAKLLQQIKELEEAANSLAPTNGKLLMTKLAHEIYEELKADGKLIERTESTEEKTMVENPPENSVLSAMRGILNPNTLNYTGFTSPSMEKFIINKKDG